MDYGDLPEVLACAPKIYEMVNCFVRSLPALRGDPMGSAVVLASMLDNAADKLKEAGVTQ